MYQNFGLYALIAVILLINVNSIEVSEKPLEIGLEIQNATVSEISQNIDKESSTQEGKTKNMTKDNFSDEKSESTTSSTVTTRLDPVTNLITKVNYSSEASSKSLKDLSKSQDAKISSTNVGITINDKVKQAIINSKTQAFKNLNDLNGNLRTKAKQDQDAKSAHVHNDITNEKPSEKEFLPSPEVSSLYTPQNVPQDHFSPMNHYYRPVKHDAQFPIELPVPKHTNTMLDTRWLGADHLPAEVHKPTAERYSSPQQRSPIRSFPFSFPSNQLNPPSHQPSPAHNKVVFPVEGRTTSGESHYQSHAHSTDANQPSWLPKSIWKWMSGDEKASTRPPTPHSYETKTLDSDLDNWKPPNELHTNTHFHHYWNSHDHSPPSTLPESWPTDHDITFKPEGKQESDGKSDEKDEEEGGKSNEKKPYYNKLTVIPPWISILGMAAAAIPIGALIAQLTPRVLYIHPNASAPLQMPFPIPNQQQFMAQLPNRPIPKASLFQQMAHRGLSHAANLSPQEIDAMLTNFLQMMDLEFKKKYQQNGEKLEGTCEDRFFCEVALQGRKVKADPMHRMLFNIALETPPDLASKSGLGEIFKAIKRLNCDVFKCSKIQKLM